MHFNLVDVICERSADRIVTLKQVTNAEEYLLDHFPSFPVLPGVMMIESLVQAARELLKDVHPSRHLVLGSVRGIKYGSFVKPGQSLRVEVSLLKKPEAADGTYEFKGEGRVISLNSQTPPNPDLLRLAVSGRFTLRPLRFD